MGHWEQYLCKVDGRGSAHSDSFGNTKCNAHSAGFSENWTRNNV